MFSFTELKNYITEEVKENEWEKTHPVDHMNIVDHYNQATKSERHAGRVWYKHANQVARELSSAHGVPVDQVAGLMSAYSPQTDWNHNMITTARVVKSKLSIGGTLPGNPKHKEWHRNPPYFQSMGGRAFAPGASLKQADRILSGEHYNSVLTGHKTGAFARLIHHGGNADDNNPDVVVDRHAYSVATGARVSDEAFGNAGLSGKKKYGMVKDAYVRAAAHINAQNGAEIGDQHYLHPHQIQAITWLVRQRLNDESDIASKKPSTKNKAMKTLTKRAAAKENWRDFSRTHLPGASYLFPIKEEVLRLVESYKRSM
jgi:hypothetical protein